MNGLFIISLDFELNWGVFDSMSIKEYNQNLMNVPLVISRLLELGEKYNVSYTFATVGMLFNENKKELLESIPKNKPEYTLKKYNSYDLIDKIGYSEKEDKIHYGRSLLDEIKKYKKHEIASHTFSHFYCKESGQDIKDFEDDLISFSKIAKKNNTDIRSIVFPKNQINEKYLALCEKHGIKTYRGTEKSFLYQPRSENATSLLQRVFRFLDSYVNITGYNIYKPQDLAVEGIVNLPSSRFLRPFNQKLCFFEKMKVRRITKGIRKAAITNSIYHLWWHPHNFGKDIDKNFENLEKIFFEFDGLSREFNLKSVTMSEANELIKKI
jgi:peptidoglycan/xylan/chitin deacetylase (PgdA/CDA1 family)